MRGRYSVNNSLHMIPVGRLHQPGSASTLYHSLFHEFSAPFQTAFPYQVVSLLLSVSIICAIFSVELFQRRFFIIPHVFSSMLKVHRRQLYCFNLEISLTPTYDIVISSGICVLRLACVAVLCFFWQHAVIYQTSVSHPSLFEIKNLCDIGLACFHYQERYDMVVHWFKAFSANSICNSSLTDSTDLSEFKSVNCLGMPALNSMRIITILVLCYALHRFILELYQLTAWLVFRSRGNLVHMAIATVACFWTGMFVIGIFIPIDIFTDSWFSSVTFVCLPLVMLAGHRSGLAVRNALLRRLEIRDNLPKLYNFKRTTSEEKY